MIYEPLELPPAGSTVVVGMSGGVDSTLAALLLKQKGCRVVGVTMALWDGHLPEIETEDFYSDACYGPKKKEITEECAKFCREHDIEYHIIDLSREYNAEVLQYFKDEYRAGKTPNPCVRCNQLVKFGALLECTKKLGIDFDYFCTGHYAMIVRPKQGLWGTDKRPCMIACADDISKDQTYFLYRLSSETLEKVRFPLAQVHKTEVFELARKANLAVADKKESQDFIDMKFFDELFSDKPSVPGDFVDVNGTVIGRHRGLEHYTVGQRRGLGVSAPNPLYVQKIDAEKNQIVLAEKNELASASLIADDFVWPGNVEPNEVFEAMIKIRLRSKSIIAAVDRYTPDSHDDYKYKGQPWKFTFDKSQNAVAPGQSVVIYKDNVIFGGGIIVKSL